MNDVIQPLILLRLSVAVLGQRDHAAWWHCQFLDAAGLESLNYNFPKAPLAAGFTATCLAAKRLHDERIGRTGVTHLFRLEPDLEMLVQRTATKEAGKLLREMPFDRELSLSELARLAGEEIDSPEGPVQVGLLEDASTHCGITALARHYHAGFRLGLRIYPYFASRRP
ncbi:MAG: BrxE family protein [Verrucomicrobia bacterium]|nr:BrxE family protein [Verrucomicrobiota bacterium]